MKKSILWMRKGLLPTILALVLSIVVVSVVTASPIPIITQTSSTATVYLDQPTIIATAEDVLTNRTFTVNLNIRDAPTFNSWQAGLTFNPDVLNCTGFYEGEKLSSVGSTVWVGEPGYINNTLGDIKAHACSLLFEVTTEGDGQLAYLTFTAKAPGVSDLHLRDVMLSDWIEVAPGEWEKVLIPCNIIDVYTVATYSVVTLSNSTGSEADYRSGFSDHYYNALLDEVGFNITSPFQGWSNVTIPNAFLSPGPNTVWGVIIDGISVSTTVTENDTHYFIYFTYSTGIHKVQITTRFAASTISMDLSRKTITLGSTVTISGDIVPARENVNVTIQYRAIAGTWATLGNVTTDSNGHYSYPWEPDETGTFEVKASWGGDPETLGDESDIMTLKVEKAGISPYVLAAVVVVIIIVAAIVVYFVRARKARAE